MRQARFATCWGCGAKYEQRSLSRKQRFCLAPRCRDLREAHAHLIVASRALERARRRGLVEGCRVIIGHVMKHAPNEATL